ncbi:MAG: hypothetical protein H6R24_2256, partial [Proteobacteria bacterium]|nr:hypothetical protein [Pseudomonadota bacterium]
VRQHEDHISALLGDAVIDGAMRRHELAIVRGTVVTDTDELAQLWVYAAEAGCWRPLAASQDSI